MLWYESKNGFIQKTIFALGKLECFEEVKILLGKILPIPPPLLFLQWFSFSNWVFCSYQEYFLVSSFFQHQLNDCYSFYDFSLYCCCDLKPLVYIIFCTRLLWPGIELASLHWKCLVLTSGRRSPGICWLTWFFKWSMGGFLFFFSFSLTSWSL